MTDLPADLDDLYAETELDFDSEPAPIDEASIDRRLATLRQARRALAFHATQADRLRADLEERIAATGRPLAERVGWLERSLQITHQAIWEQDKRRTRIVTPNGVLASKAGGVEWVWPDEGTPEHEALTAWVKDHLPDAYNQPAAPAPRPDKNAVKAAVKPYAVTKTGWGESVPVSADGTVVTDQGPIPGLVVQAKPRTFNPEPIGIDGED